jgi:chaperonin cofactor prefoldin
MNIEELIRKCDDLEKRVSQIEARHRKEDEGWEEIRQDIKKFKGVEAFPAFPVDKP